MRRIVFIVLIILVVAVVGFYAFLEFRTNEIFFEADTVDTWDYGMRVRRVYRSGVDEDAFIAKSEESLITAEFTEEEHLAAALASGTPEFCPAFYFNIYNPDNQTDVFSFVGSVKSEALPDQTSFNFMLADLHLEIITDGIAVSDFEPGDEQNAKSFGTPIISENGRQFAVNLGSFCEYSLLLTGTGRVTFQYNYSIISGGLFSRPALEEQLLIVHVNISRGAGGEMVVEFINEPYSMIEDFLG
jgi:hypothetical protein